jgi:glycosyltransferase involved in cell wall biosynthesis
MGRVLRIGINALFLLPGKVGGSEIYLRNLVKWLLDIDKDNIYIIFINRESRGLFDSAGSRIDVVLCPINAENRPLRIIYEQLILPFQIRRYKIDILLSAGMTSPFFCPAASVLVIHDLHHLNLPENFPLFKLIFLRSIIFLSAKTADGIIAISEKVKNDLMKLYHITSERIKVIYHAADLNTFSPGEKNEVAKIRTKYNLPGRFILCIASSLPHKNHKRLIQAFRKVKSIIPGMKLVLAGTTHEGFEKIIQKIKEMQLEDDIFSVGWIPFEDIPLLYSASELLVFPSLHEGFGLPLLEAMACGLPVVCSKIEPLTEIAGDAAFFVNPYNCDDIADGIVSVLQNEELQKNLIDRGFRKAQEFTWVNTAQKTISFLSSYKNE